jgi:hypothetical protein
VSEEQKYSPGSTGPATDRMNNPVIDPTANVYALVEAAIKRQDDLREAESRHVREIAQLRADYAQELRDAETQRIDAIRAVDVGNVQRAAEVQAGVAQALEGKVTATAAAFESRLSATINPIQTSIDDLRRAQYEAQGQKTQVVESRAGVSTQTAIVGAAVGVILIILTLAALALSLYVATHK